jgi:hypothetical protein
MNELLFRRISWSGWFVALAIILLVENILFSTAARGQQAERDNSLQVAIKYGEAKSLRPVSFQGITQKVGLHPNQVVTVALQFPVNRAGESVVVRPLDGGKAILPDRGLVVGKDGSAKFDFQANATPGSSNVAIEIGGEEYGLQFYVLNDTNPSRNPKVPIAD